MVYWAFYDSTQTKDRIPTQSHRWIDLTQRSNELKLKQMDI